MILKTIHTPNYPLTYLKSQQIQITTKHPKVSIFMRKASLVRILTSLAKRKICHLMASTMRQYGTFSCIVNWQDGSRFYQPCNGQSNLLNSDHLIDGLRLSYKKILDPCLSQETQNSTKSTLGWHGRTCMKFYMYVYIYIW